MAAVMRRAKTRPKRRARNKAEALNIGNWFAKLGKKKQAEYVKDHPNSIYAKQDRKATDKGTRDSDQKGRIKVLEATVNKLKAQLAKNQARIKALLGEGKQARKRMPDEKQSWEYARENMEIRKKIKVLEDRIQRLR